VIGNSGRDSGVVVVAQRWRVAESEFGRTFLLVFRLMQRTNSSRDQNNSGRAGFPLLCGASRSRPS
jgi:hypothetical protein